MKIRLINKSRGYQLFINFDIIEFNLNDISFLKIQKKYCYLSIIYILTFSVVTSSTIYNYFSLNLFFLFMYFIIISLSFVVILYNHIYLIDIIIHTERISFETKDKNLVNDFFMLQYFYNEMEVDAYKPCKKN